MSYGRNTRENETKKKIKKGGGDIAQKKKKRRRRGEGERERTMEERKETRGGREGRGAGEERNLLLVGQRVRERVREKKRARVAHGRTP